jgi:hypothetical protein
MSELHGRGGGFIRLFGEWNGLQYTFNLKGITEHLGIGHGKGVLFFLELDLGLGFFHLTRYDFYDYF